MSCLCLFGFCLNSRYLNSDCMLVVDLVSRFTAVVRSWCEQLCFPSIISPNELC